MAEDIEASAQDYATMAAAGEDLSNDNFPASARPLDEDIMAHHHQICAEETQKFEFVGDKEPISVLATEYKSGSAVFKEKIEKLASIYGAIRRTRGDGNCFFRSFMFSYLEYVLESKNEAEVARIVGSVERCKQALIALGYAEFTFEDFLAVFVEQLESVLPGKESSISVDTLLDRCRDQYISNYVVMFFRFVTSCEIRQRADFFEPFIFGMSNLTVQQFCKASVEPMGEESDHIHITALTDALGVPVRIVYLDRSLDDEGKVAEVNHHDFIPASSLNPEKTLVPPVILLYRPGHYDILYAK